MNKSYQIGERERVKNHFYADKFKNNNLFSKTLIYNEFLVKQVAQIQINADTKNSLDLLRN
jgi:hypothetical protein